MNLANSLTLSRFIIAPLFILIFSIHSLWAYLGCFFLAVLLEVTDILDGKIARRYRQVSDFGKLMDPFADSVSRFSIFLSFLSAGLAPLWMIAIFFYRDVLVAIVRVFAMRQGAVVAARRSGKIKALLQAVCILFVLTGMVLKKMDWLGTTLAGDESFYWLTTALIGMAAAITLWSAYDYWTANKVSVIGALSDSGKQQQP